MKLLVEPTLLCNLLHDAKIKCECYTCGNAFDVKVSDAKFELKKQRGRFLYCSRACIGRRQGRANPPKSVPCTHCGATVTKVAASFKEGRKPFCGKSCAATYRNTHKTTGTQRSKLEVWLEEKLSAKYPELPILYCDKTTINSELDIYFPTLKFAVELNGIVHYEPIYGEDKLAQIKNNDFKKLQACYAASIEALVLDTSKLRYFKESNTVGYLDTICNIVDAKLAFVKDTRGGQFS